MKLRRPRAALLAWFCFCCAVAVRAEARNGLGPIPTGRGGVNQAFSDNAEMVVDNPSSMVNVTGDGLCELGVTTAIPVSSYSDSYGNDVNSLVRPQPGPVLGITKTLPSRRWAVGIGLFAPNSFGASYGELANPIFGPTESSSRGILIRLLPAVAYKATDRLALGLSFGAGLSYSSFKGPMYLQSGPLVGTPVLLDARGTGVAPIGAVGMQYQLFENTRIGATYTVPSDFWLRGATNATFSDGGLIESHFNSKMRLRWPSTLAFGVKHDFCPHRRMAADLIWTHWAGAFSDINLLIYDPSNPAVESLVAAAGGSLPIDVNMPQHWTDTVTFRLGYEADLSDTNTLRLGYDYQPSAAPESTFNPFVTNVLQHVFSIGFSHKLRHTIFNVAYQYAMGQPLHIGTSGLIGGQFDNSNYESDAHYATMSFSVPY